MSSFAENSQAESLQLGVLMFPQQWNAAMLRSHFVHHLSKLNLANEQISATASR
jgi:hypothetical protein